MGDLISRQDAISMIDDLIGGYIPIGTSTFKEGVVDGYMRAKSRLKTLPTIDPVKHGKWSPCIVARNIDAIECSECGAKYPNMIRCMWMPGYNYCPNCGADMRGE